MPDRAVEQRDSDLRGEFRGRMSEMHIIVVAIEIDVAQDTRHRQRVVRGLHAIRVQMGERRMHPVLQLPVAVAHGRVASSRR